VLNKRVSLVCVWPAALTPDMGLRSGTAIIFCINAKDDELCEAVPDIKKKLFEEKWTSGNRV
jgi:hypothetical protein